MEFKFDPYMNMEYSTIMLNGKIYGKAEILDIIGDVKRLNSLQENLKQIFSFIAEWTDDSDEIIVHTSGSTGKPKIISVKKEHMINSALMTQNFFGLNKNSNVLLCMPVKYIAGKMMVVRTFVTGFNLMTLSPAANPFSGFNHRIDFTALTPFQLYHSVEDIQRLNIHQIIVGGGEIPVNLEKKIKHLSASIYATYGMTETSTHVALRKVNGDDSSEIYFALSGIRFELDERSCLIIQAPALTNEDIVTNDVIDLIDETHFTWKGRYDNVINTGGIKVFPEAVEAKLSEFINKPFFISYAKDEILSEKIVLIMQGIPLPEKDKSYLTERMKRVLTKYEMPREIIYLDKFKYSGSGKILRSQTRELASL